MIKQRIPQGLKNQWHRIQAQIAILLSGYPAKSLTVIGVTGTDGKTTTSTLIYHILKSAGMKVALISTVAAYIGDEAIDTGFHVTTPDPLSLQRLLKKIVDAGFTHVVLEATSHGLDQHRLDGTNIQYAVFTNITSEHLDYHRTYQKYVEAKSKLMRHATIAILNQDDDSFAPLKKLAPHTINIIPYSLKSCPAWIKKRFNEHYNQSNAMAAYTLAKVFTIDDAIVEKALGEFRGIPGRMEEISNTRDMRIIVDFAHTPNALENALTSLRKTTKNKLIAVYGAAGQRDAFKRPLMGEIGSRLADEVVLTAEDPRTEQVQAIIRQMKSGIKQNHGHVHAIIDRREAIDFAINTLAKTGDTVGIFGKGHERSMNLDGKTEIPWSDQAVVRECLNNPSISTHPECSS